MARKSRTVSKGRKALKSVNQVKVRMLRTVGKCKVGGVYSFAHYRAIELVESGLATLNLNLPLPAKSYESPVDRMLRSYGTKG
jgi:hypothetical protein